MFKLFLLFLLFFILPFHNVESKCSCECVNGKNVPLCSSTLDIAPPCIGICPIVNPSIKPLPSLNMPPVGTSKCDWKQVYNEATRRYEWVEVCS